MTPLRPTSPEGGIQLDGAPGPWWPAEGRPVVVVQGLGFVGSAMCAAVAAAVDGNGSPAFEVIGVDLDDAAGRRRVDALNDGRLPFASDDPDLLAAVGCARAEPNLVCCWDETAYALADVVVIDVPLDVDWTSDPPQALFEPFVAAVRAVARNVRPGALVLIETTVAPGTTERVIVPAVHEELVARGVDAGDVHIAHSYERVMPGPGYLRSITELWRVYSGTTPAAADAAERFLSSIVDVERFPMRRLASTTASETAKVLENTYRATTIALMDEWSRFAEAADVDLFEVVEAIRDRPTHVNMRTPGLGVGGYCLTKDPLFGALSASEVLGLDVSFPMSTGAVEINRRSPLAAARMASDLLGGSLEGRSVLLCGATYRPGVGDTRSSPSETFAVDLIGRGAELSVHDPMVRAWAEVGLPCLDELPSPPEQDLVVFAVAHDLYCSLDLARWLGDRRPAVLDASGVLSGFQRAELRRLGCVTASIGRGPGSGSSHMHGPEVR